MQEGERKTENVLVRANYQNGVAGGSVLMFLSTLLTRGVFMSLGYTQEPIEISARICNLVFLQAIL